MNLMERIEDAACILLDKGASLKEVLLVVEKLSEVSKVLNGVGLEDLQIPAVALRVCGRIN